MYSILISVRGSLAPFSHHGIEAMGKKKKQKPEVQLVKMPDDEWVEVWCNEDGILVDAEGWEYEYVPEPQVPMVVSPQAMAVGIGFLAVLCLAWKPTQWENLNNTLDVCLDWATRTETDEPD